MSTKKMNRSSPTKIDGGAEVLLIPMPTSGDYSLYFHIPFCTKKCDYCHFYVIPDKDNLKNDLALGFSLEWERIRSHFIGRNLSSIYFGGGTPSLFGPERIREILKITGSAPEITLEANPELLTLDLMRGYKEAGINRVSLGLQSLSPSLLVKLGRSHTSSEGLNAIETLASAGFENISVDLMYDLPGQTFLDWQYSLETVLKSPITHLSLYNLSIEPSTLFFKNKQKIEKELPSQETSLKMYQEAIRLSHKYGFNQYEISAFAKPGFHSVHNTGYWLGREFWGLGPSAFSYWNGKRFKNVSNLSKYLKSLQENKSPTDFEEKLENEAKIRELFVIQLRVLQPVPIPLFMQTQIEKLEKEGFLSLSNNSALLTSKGVLFHDALACELI